MKRKFQRRKIQDAVDVDITSLLDILTILLVFLLKSYNSSDLKLDIQKNVEVADSEARELTRFAPVIQVDKEQNLFVNDQKIGRIPASGDLKNLTDALVNERKNIEERNSKLKKSTVAPKHELVNLLFDKDLDYKVVERVMHSSATAGFSQFKFIVKGNF
jgi:biopolymer transport protein ExbD